jgi:CDP-glycerol glycerophosphotransferase
METPIVSVVIPVHNAMPYLLKGIESLRKQSIGMDRIEVIAVDDGSTDDSGQALDDFAAAEPHTVRVIHQQASGSPSGPRNLGIELARGEFVFFLDADDYLGVEALERLVAMAEEQESDVVLGKGQGVDGRVPPVSMFKRTQPRADLYSSRIYWTLGPWKLYRRSLLNEHGIRFPADRRIGEDQLFTFNAYYHARNISVVADYDCYYIVQRDDGGNLHTGGTPVPEGREFSAKPLLLTMAELVASKVPAGPERDHLMKRHWEVEGDNMFAAFALESEPERRQRHFDALRDTAQLWYTPGAAATLSRTRQLNYQLVLNGLPNELAWALGHPDDLVFAGRGDRVYLALPGHDHAVGTGAGPWVDLTASLEIRHWLKRVELTGTHLLIEGTARLAPVPSDLIRLRLEAVQCRTGAVRAFDLPHDDGHFTLEAAIADFTKLNAAQGDWYFEIVVGVDRAERRAPFGDRLGGPLHGKRHPVPQRTREASGQWQLAQSFTKRGNQLMLSTDRRLTARRLAEACRRRITTR